MTFSVPAGEWTAEQVEEFRELWEAAQGNAAHFKHHPPPTRDDVAITDAGE